MATDRPPKPECGKFQTVEWDEKTDYWLIRDMTQAELDEAYPPEPVPEPDPAEAARDKRNRLLRDSDWAVLPDAPASNEQEWRDYRQALRDVPQQSGFPDDITWPTKPTA